MSECQLGIPGKKAKRENVWMEENELEPCRNDFTVHSYAVFS